MEKRACLISSSVQGKDAYKLVDRISELPDEILVRILSLLPLKEAGATSTLSRRWLYMWASTKNLNFDADETVRRYYWEYNQELKDQESSKYVDWVNHVVEQHREQEDLEQFRVCFLGLDNRFTSSIDKWIQFAMKKRVQVLVLDFVTRLYDAKHYTFSNYLETSSEHFSFESLKVLHLECVNVTGDVLECMLRNCPFLEQVSVYYANNLVELSVVDPSIALKYLEIRYCGDIKRIQIRDANLVSLSYSGRPIELDLSNVPLLIEVSICYDGFTDESMRLAFTHLSCCINQLQTLMLDIPMFVQVHQKNFPVLPNLKNLEVRVCADACQSTLPVLTSFMKAFPNLQRLVLKLEFSFPFNPTEGEKMFKGLCYGIYTEKCPHRNIKVVEILGYRHASTTVELVNYIVKNVVALDKIVIDPARNWAHHGTRANKRIEEVKLEEEARDHAMHFIRKVVPSSVEFVCL
ncbi:putative F-box/LRR-repeat protein At5g38386 [Rosa rugosa]|uniref:putative F-box/LRR-repeat protein At5g38386 n=1 Tax=Rosa rugosa TaxID=74645 RepID=UPI002B402349|nr:putative F-box/LRR-repeat protein At5g38386 [Rosa rugosa]XP_061997451.1 putative F-box/LRR-repeat protein At5g38386 [Rosa rugosa]XP_061997452.1 putative F-box/LRR-repeat protein At5g38386 [Rosa rugosa]XP_061997453.1 putative F-box/LRR-repeat protein At5g38386 [Rosa rugosa]XP_061997454.1 putative F-box/LRR-repeat protein At5g38386 [Rosa rugosa]